MYLVWSSRIFTPEFSTMESLMMGEEIMSFNSCVTTMAAVRCFLAVFQSSSM